VQWGSESSHVHFEGSVIVRHGPVHGDTSVLLASRGRGILK